MAVVRRFAKGPVLGISPSTSRSTLPRTRWPRRSPAGAPIVLKPALKTPLSALLLGEILAETDLPEGTWSILRCDSRSAELVQGPGYRSSVSPDPETVGYDRR